MKNMTLHLRIWRQKNAATPGKLVDYTLSDVSPDMSFLEMLDVLNEQLIKKGDDPLEYDNDCREGICGMCSLVINGVPHGSERGTATCQLHMRKFSDGDTITVEPFRARPFPVVKDLVVDRSAFDKIMAVGGYVSCHVGAAVDANAILIPKDMAEKAMDYAACIGCGACVAACPNASASLFVAAKISHLAHLPQGDVEARQRAIHMVEKMDELGFGDCSNHGECEAVCPKEISISAIALMRRHFFKAVVS